MPNRPAPTNAPAAAIGLFAIVPANTAIMKDSALIVEYNIADFLSVECTVDGNNARRGICCARQFFERHAVAVLQFGDPLRHVSRRRVFGIERAIHRHFDTIDRDLHTVDALTKLDLPAGVEIEIKL